MLHVLSVLSGIGLHLLVLREEILHGCGIEASRFGVNEVTDLLQHGVATLCDGLLQFFIGDGQTHLFTLVGYELVVDEHLPSGVFGLGVFFVTESCYSTGVFHHFLIGVQKLLEFLCVDFLSIHFSHLHAVLAQHSAYGLYHGLGDERKKTQGNDHNEQDSLASDFL